MTHTESCGTGFGIILRLERDWASSESTFILKRQRLSGKAALSLQLPELSDLAVCLDFALNLFAKTQRHH